MPRFKSSQEWLEQSTLLLEARPETTRITSRYAIKPAPAPKPKPDPETLPDAPAAAPRGRFVLRTFDPVSGVNLRYRTTKAAEVSRLVQMLGSLARRQAGLPAQEEAPAAVEDAGEGPAGVAAQPPAQPPPQQAGGAGGGSKGKKKKGKR